MAVRQSFHPSPARAQISLEALLLFALFLSILSVALFTSSKISGMAQGRVDEALSRQAFNEFSSKASSACALGNGNSRAFSANSQATLDYRQGGIAFTMLGRSYILPLACPVFIEKAESGKFKIENKEGRITIS